MTKRLFCLIKNGNNSNSHSGVTALKFHKWQPKKTLSPAHIYILSIKYSIQWHSILTTLCKRVYISTHCLFKYSIGLLEKKYIYKDYTVIFRRRMLSNFKQEGWWPLTHHLCELLQEKQQSSACTWVAEKSLSSNPRPEETVWLKIQRWHQFHRYTCDIAICHSALPARAPI